MNRNHYIISRWITIILVCYLPIVSKFIPQTNFGPGIPDVDVTRLMSYFLVLIFVVEFSITKQLTLNCWVVILFCFAVIKSLSPFWSHWHTFDAVVLQNLLNTTFIPLMVGIVAINAFTSENDVKNYMIHVLIAASVLSCISLFQFLFFPSLLDDGRSSATLNNPNLLAVYLVICIPCCLYSIKEKIIKPRFGWLVMVLIACGILSTVSRKGIITMAMCCIIYFIYDKQSKKMILFLLLASFLVIPLQSLDIISKRFEKTNIEKAMTGKWALSSAGIKMFLEKPLVGNGYEGYVQRYREFFPNSWVTQYDAHNEYITALANYGIIGFSFFIMIFLYPLMIARRHSRQSDDHQRGGAFKEKMAVLCVSTVIPFMFSAFYAGRLFSQAMVVNYLFVQIAFVFISTEKEAMAAEKFKSPLVCNAHNG